MTKTVFTNGCFDVLHAGHIRILQHAKLFGDKLIVGLNSDASIKRLKGPTRPIVPQYERQEILSAIGVVDEVIIFEEDTPIELIKSIKPDVLVKGPDYFGQKIVGHDEICSWGGMVVIPNWEVTKSSTATIDKIIPVQNLAVNGKTIEDWDKYTIRFYLNGQSWQPVLYKNGKRVIDDWVLRCYHAQQRDENGSSA